MSRFEGAPVEMDPRYLFPEAKSCIGFAFRIPRGYFRGIEEGTFYGCFALARVILPKGLHSIGRLAYGDCASLKTLPLPNGLVEIGEKAFFNCENLTHLELPRSLKRIGKDAFVGCCELMLSAPRGSYAEAYVRGRQLRHILTDNAES